ncbi:RNA polymerase sigma factor [Pseudofulvibacter geojedonensis]|uniref:RNA polymerase sigma factor n=1 Tax=Pseudofulvibacter geojedonensis TaxID=1123758 RepID=A0ABW3I4K6_9FLAO
MNFLFRKKQSFTDDEIIRILTSNHRLENAVLRFLYTEVQPSLYKLILSKGGISNDAEDIIQDAIIVFYEKAKQNQLQIEKTITGYIYTVGKYMWYNRLRKNKEHLYLDSDHVISLGLDEFDLELFHTNETRFVQELLSKISKACQNILQQSIFERITMDKIALLHGYKNEQIARNKKYRCLKDLRSIVEQSTQYQTVINELCYE